MNINELIPKYIAESELMQLATVRDNKPWICTVHFVEDSDLNLYWLSLPSRRHSQDIEKNNHVATAIAVKRNKPVVGIQAEGTASIIQDKETVKTIMKKYVEKYSIGGNFFDNFVAGKNQHVLYKFTPENFVLFDEMNFQGDMVRQEWKQAK